MYDEMMKNLKRALYYEVQYRNAIVSDSLFFYDINVTKNLIESDFFVKNAGGEPVSCLNTVDLTAPANFTEFITRWFDLQIPDSLKSVYADFVNIRQKLLDAYSLGKREYTVEYWSYDAFSHKIFINQKFYMTQNEDGEICALSVVKDFTNQKQNEQILFKKEIEQYAYKDPLTEGYNYNKFKQELLKIGQEGTIICLDIHSFKIINTICGIATGDMVIKTIWECIMCVLHPEQKEIAAHINADHFVIFLPTKDKKVTVSKINNITIALSLLSVELDIPQIQPYFGTTEWKPGKRIELAYSEAITAKHNAKQSQAENYAFFNEEDSHRLVEEKQMADSFSDALSQNEFKIWYQPKYNPVTNRLVGAEALVRWQKSDGSLIPPGKFIPLFEHNGMIRTLDEYIFRTVCRQQKFWQSLGKKIVPVSINLSRVSLYYKSIATQYKYITEEIGIDKDLIPIEITESAAVNNIILKKAADQFYKNGFRLHMDDFGSGYSSLASLNTLHFDTLKLDKSLIDYIGNFGGDRLIEHTISLAKDLGMQVTAEGVENSSQVKFLKHNGCDSIQGFFYSMPVTKEEFEKLLEDENSTGAEEVDYLSAHISELRRRFLKSSFIKFIANLSTGKFVEISKHGVWGKYQDAPTFSYNQCVDIIAKKHILEKDRERFYDFMDRDKIMKNFSEPEETKILYLKSSRNGQKMLICIMFHIFKIENSKDFWAFFTMEGNC